MEDCKMEFALLAKKSLFTPDESGFQHRFCFFATGTIYSWHFAVFTVFQITIANVSASVCDRKN
jgi:hypothetical protein